MTPIELVWLVAIAHIWARGSLFKSMREWEPRKVRAARAIHESKTRLVPFAPRMPRMLLNCPLCSGFWIGVLGHALYLRAPGIVEWLGVGALVGSLALAVCGAIRRL
jgi:hypothetical protein